MMGDKESHEVTAMQIIDTHVHIFPEKIAHAAVEATGKFYANLDLETPPSLEAMTGHAGTAEELLKIGAEAGIDRFLVFSTATAARQVESVNTFIANQCRAHPEFIGAGTMHIDYENFEAEVERIQALGLRGIKLHPDIQRFTIDDPRILPLYEILGAKHMFLIAHTGDYRYDFSGPKRTEHVARMFPGTKFICAHFGGWGEWAEARERLPQLENVYVDTSSTFGFVGPDSMREGFKVFDPTHIFFGSDYPMWTPGVELASVQGLGLGDALLEDVLGGNFLRFLEEL